MYSVGPALDDGGMLSAGCPQGLHLHTPTTLTLSIRAMNNRSGSSKGFIHKLSVSLQLGVPLAGPPLHSATSWHGFPRSLPQTTAAAAMIMMRSRPFDASVGP